MSGVRADKGGDIDRAQPLRFSFQGKMLSGFAGDTLASALLANGVNVVGRSFKYHRPRGLLAAGVEEPNALMQVGDGARRAVNLRATEIELYEGLVARPVNCWPNVDFDLGAVNNLLSQFIPAGFYYKTLMWPNWLLFEPFIRRAAGLGDPSREADPDRYDQIFAHCDVLVVGAGPAGLAAALAASSGGARVILAETEPTLGGSLRWRAGEIEGLPGAAWALRAEQKLRACAETRILSRTTAVGYFDHNAVALVETLPHGASVRQRLWHVRAAQVVLAGGAFERPLVFPGNDRPGVMLAGAVERYLGQYAVRAGERLALFTNNDAAYSVIEPFVRAGGAIVAVIDPRGGPSESVARRLQALSVEFIGGVVVGTHGSPALSSITVRSGNGQDRRIVADVLAISGGLNPVAHLFKQSGGALRWDEALCCLLPGVSVQAERSAGAANGAFSLAEALASGDSAGRAAATLAGKPADAATAAPETSVPAEPYAISALWRVRSKGKAFVDFQNDVTASDISLAAQENYISVEHLKRYTTLGMAPDQGKTSNVNALAIMSEITGSSIPEAGTTGFRFPFTPIAMGVLAGRNRGELFRPIRRLSAHARHTDLGAVFEEYGGWMRPAYFLRDGETPHQAEQREALAARTSAALFDASSLGKIEVTGPDAGVFLDRIYANAMSNLKPGALRYGVMLNELGVVIDDGVVARLSADSFLLSTTSGGASRIAAWLEEWLQCEWMELDVLVAPVTTSRAVMTLSGPRAREILAAAGTDILIGKDEFPHLTFREGRVAGLPVRVSRVSFTGDVSFEIAAPWSEAERLWDALHKAGQPFGVVPVGMEAWMLLRTEKGFLHVGADTDGTTTALDIGWSKVMKRQSDFIGRRSLMRPADQAGDRLNFVGLQAVDGPNMLPVGAQICRRGGGDASEGYVTSSGFSPMLGCGVALGMVKAGRARLGEVMDAQTPDGRRSVRIAKPGIYDPTGERLHG